YTDRDGRHSERTLHAYGIVAHAGRWYVTGKDARIGEDRTLRLDRITEARALPGLFDAPVDPDPARRVLSGFATAEYRHEVTLRIHGTAEQIRAHLPASVASLDEDESPAVGDPATERWLRVELRAERLDWLPPALAGLNRPFVIERPDELRDRVLAFADRLADCARRT
ncbi:WYL domain-containing protein, partial [Kitasatospora griseola]|uniref:WYL domain-containing protein n=1 Tax=Kitasatospora griseola TaxID=2064 RepID=UPI0037F66891